MLFAHHSSYRTLRALGVFLGLALSLTVPMGCSKESKKLRHLERGDQFYKEGNFDRAEIEYFNVLQVDNRSAHAAGRIGLIYFDQGRLGRAFEFLSGAVQMDPKDTVSRNKIALIQLSVGNREQAMSEATTVLKQSPEDPEAPIILTEAAITPEMIVAARETLNGLPGTVAAKPAVLVAQGILLVREGKVDEALKLFQQAVATDPTFAAAYSAIGAIHASRREFPEADAALAKSAQYAGPRSPRGVQYALFKIATGDKDGGKKILEEIQAKAPNYLPATLRLVDLAASENRLDDAESMLAAVLKRDPSSPEALLMNSRIASAKKNPDKAMEQIQRLLQLYPKLPEAHFEAARIHLSRNELTQANASLNQAIANNPDYRDAILLLANLDTRQNKAGDSILALRKLLGTEVPKKGMQAQALEPHVLLAEALRVQKDFAGSLAVYDQLEAAAPGSPPVALMRGMLLRQLNRPAEARAALDEAQKRAPKSTGPLEQLMELDLADKQPDQALARVNRALAENPDSAEMKLVAARLHLSRNERAPAEALLRKALEIQPNLTQAYTFLARIYMDSGESDRALENLTAVVQRNPRDNGAWFIIGTLQEKKQDYAAARDAYEKSLEAEPRFPATLNNLAYIYAIRMGQLDKGLELARKARELAPQDPNIADTLGWIAYLKGDYAWAVGLLRESAEKLPNEPEVKFHLAMTQYMLGDETSAKTNFEAALALKADFPGADQAKARLTILTLDATSGTAATLASLERHLADQPKDSVALSKLAALQEKQGAMDKAIATQQRAVDANPQNARAMVTLARLLGAAGETTKALEVGRAARKLAPDDVEVLVVLGGLSLQAKEFSAAFNLLQEANRKRENDASLLSLLADAAYSMGRVTEARTALAAALKLVPDATGREKLGLIEAAANQTSAAAALATAQARLKRVPEDVAALMVLAAASRDSAVAVSTLERVLKVYPDFGPAKRALAVLLAVDPKNDARTLELAGQVREQYRDDAELNRAAGFAAYRQGEFRRAITLLEPLRTGLASDSAYWFHLGMSQGKVNQKAPAMESLQKALTLGLTGAAADEANAFISSK